MPTIRDVLEKAIPQLAAAGVDSPQLDTELLLAHVLQKQRGWLLTYPEHELTPAEAAQFAVMLERRLQREPLAYLLGEWEFYGRPFYVTPTTIKSCMTEMPRAMRPNGVLDSSCSLSNLTSTTELLKAMA